MNILRQIKKLLCHFPFTQNVSMHHRKPKSIKIPILLLCLIATSSWATSDDYSRGQWQEQWIATWGAPPMAPGSAFEAAKTFENQTIRQIVPVSLGGQRIRIRVSNVFGSQPLRIGSAHIALQADGASIVTGSDRTLKFSGFTSITVPIGAVAVSDPVDLSISTLAKVAVSLYLPGNTGPATYFEASTQTAYISGAGDFTGSATLPTAETSMSRYFLSIVEVAAHRNARTVVAIGDSVTKGATATSWPGFLFSRLNSYYSTSKIAVVNQGIGCGRILRDFCGQAAAARFDRDALTVTGATHVIVALGLVDIIMPSAFGMPVDQVASTNDIIGGLKQLIERAHAQGLTVYGATITPFGSSIFPNVYTSENEATRKAVNRWIRTSGAFDAVIDFDAAVRDPNDRTRYVANYSDDGIHPNDIGNEVMAGAIDLDLFE